MIIVDLGYKSLVMSNKDAIALAEIIERAEVYQSIWIAPAERNGGADTTHHIYENDGQLAMRLVSNDFYRMAKLAGKPEKK